MDKLTEARARWDGSPFRSMEHSFSVDVCKLLQDSLTVEDELARVCEDLEKSQMGRALESVQATRLQAERDKLREELESARIVLAAARLTRKKGGLNTYGLALGLIESLEDYDERFGGRE